MDARPSPFEPHLRPDLPPPSGRWAGFPAYNFVGGHNAPEGVPVADLTAALAGRPAAQPGLGLQLLTALLRPMARSF